MGTRPPSVYEYGDYRRFLADYYAHQKEHQYGFSFRVFSRRAGIRSTNYLRLVIDGKRNLTKSMAVQFARGCELSGTEADFFCELVEYCQAQSQQERSRSYERLAGYRQFRAVRKLDAAQARYHSSWYVPAIRELVRRPDFQEDPKWIAAQLVPRISAREASRALALLLRLSLLERGADGRLQQATPLVTTGPGPLGHHVYGYHHAMLERAGDALDRMDRTERELSSITVCVSQSKLEELKERVRVFRRQLLQEAELEGVPERVVQINFQLFPLSVGPAEDVSEAAAPKKKRARAAGARRSKS